MHHRGSGNSIILQRMPVLPPMAGPRSVCAAGPHAAAEAAAQESPAARGLQLPPTLHVPECRQHYHALRLPADRGQGVCLLQQHSCQRLCWTHILCGVTAAAAALPAVQWIRDACHVRMQRCRCNVALFAQATTWQRCYWHYRVCEAQKDGASVCATCILGRTATSIWNFEAAFITAYFSLSCRPTPYFAALLHCHNCRWSCALRTMRC